MRSPLYFDRGLLPIVEVFEGELKLHTRRLYFLGSTGGLLATATAHAEHVENVSEPRSLRASLSQTFFSILVIELALVSVHQNLVSNSNLLEL